MKDGCGGAVHHFRAGGRLGRPSHSARRQALAGCRKPYQVGARVCRSRSPATSSSIGARAMTGDGANALPQYRTEIDGQAIHFIHVRSAPRRCAAATADARLAWFRARVRQLDRPLVNPTAHGGVAEDAFHLVIPSLPGYGFSGGSEEQSVFVRRHGQWHIAARSFKLIGQAGKAFLIWFSTSYVDGNLSKKEQWLADPQYLPDLGDGDAHVQFIHDASFPTFVLAHWGIEPRGRPSRSKHWCARSARIPAIYTGKAIAARWHRASARISTRSTMTGSRSAVPSRRADHSK